MSLGSKVKMCKTRVRLVMTYVIETRAETTITITSTKNNGNEHLKMHHWQHTCEIRDVRRRPESETRSRAWRDHVNRMDDNWFAKITKNEKLDTLRLPKG
jgi:hypothetical protein